MGGEGRAYLQHSIKTRALRSLPLRNRLFGSRGFKFCVEADKVTAIVSGSSVISLAPGGDGDNGRELKSSEHPSGRAEAKANTLPSQ